MKHPITSPDRVKIVNHDIVVQLPAMEVIALGDAGADIRLRLGDKLVECTVTKACVRESEAYGEITLELSDAAWRELRQEWSITDFYLRGPIGMAIETRDDG